MASKFVISVTFFGADDDWSHDIRNRFLNASLARPTATRSCSEIKTQAAVIAATAGKAPNLARDRLKLNQSEGVKRTIKQ